MAKKKRPRPNSNPFWKIVTFFHLPLHPPKKKGLMMVWVQVGAKPGTDCSCSNFEWEKKNNWRICNTGPEWQTRMLKQKKIAGKDGWKTTNRMSNCSFHLLMVLFFLHGRIGNGALWCPPDECKKRKTPRTFVMGVKGGWKGSLKWLITTPAHYTADCREWALCLVRLVETGDPLLSCRDFAPPAGRHTYQAGPEAKNSCKTNLYWCVWVCVFFFIRGSVFFFCLSALLLHRWVKVVYSEKAR